MLVVSDLVQFAVCAMKVSQEVLLHGCCSYVIHGHDTVHFMYFIL